MMEGCVEVVIGRDQKGPRDANQRSRTAEDDFVSDMDRNGQMG